MLSKRLNYLCSLVPKCNTVVDVGCDHGLLSQELLKSGKVARCILTDISLPSLEKAKRLLKTDYPLCTFHHTDGLCKINEDYDFCVIAGMGGLETIKIISQANPPCGMLQPMNNLEKLRMFLVENGYKITLDKVFKDSKFYFVILFEKGNDTLENAQVLFGKTNLANKSQDFLDYLKMKKEKSIAIMQGLEKHSSRMQELNSYILEIDKLLEIDYEN